MFLAGVDVGDGIVLDLAHRLRNAQLTDTADKLERAWSNKDKTVALETDDRDALLRILAHGPDELADLRSVLQQEHERKQAGGH